MKITDVDKNFNPNCLANCPYDMEWFSATDKKFSLHGVFYSEQDEQFLRLPLDVANATSENVGWLASHTSGGRVRIRTTSPVIAYQATIKYVGIMQNMDIMGQMGFALYLNGRYKNTYAPTESQINERNGEKIFHCNYVVANENDKGDYYDYEFYFPLYNPVFEFYVGFPKGAKFEQPKEYKHKSPVIYYGSSITQGGCASHPGNDYEGQLSRLLDTDYITLGFSGNAKGEKVMAEYIASIPHSVFVMDYDHNAPDVEHLKNTHYAFYKTYREKCKNTPIIFASKPDYLKVDKKEDDKRRRIVKATYIKAIQEGDRNVYFIDGRRFFGKDYNECTVDGCHPNDLGFYKMAKTFYPILKNLLDEKDN